MSDDENVVEFSSGLNLPTNYYLVEVAKNGFILRVSTEENDSTEVFVTKEAVLRKLRNDLPEIR